MTKITILSGFGQKPETLQNVFNSSLLHLNDVIALDYLKNKNFEDLLTRDLEAYDNDVVIAWSLGGQVAIRLIEKQILKPKLLILIATPFQYVQNEKNKIGIEKHNFDSFKSVLKLDSIEALKHLAYLSAGNDENPDWVLQNMEPIKNISNLESWFQELKDFTCFDVDFKNFPKTIYVCGDGDAVVNCFQHKYFNERIADFELQIMFHCGHAPHFSHRNEFLNIINEKI